jgi:hypothetical protein
MPPRLGTHISRVNFLSNRSCMAVQSRTRGKESLVNNELLKLLLYKVKQGAESHLWIMNCSNCCSPMMTPWSTLTAGQHTSSVTMKPFAFGLETVCSNVWNSYNAHVCAYALCCMCACALCCMCAYALCCMCAYALCCMCACALCCMCACALCCMCAYALCCMCAYALCCMCACALQCVRECVCIEICVSAQLCIMNVCLLWYCTLFCE